MLAITKMSIVQHLIALKLALVTFSINNETRLRAEESLSHYIELVKLDLPLFPEIFRESTDYIESNNVTFAYFDQGADIFIAQAGVQDIRLECELSLFPKMKNGNLVF